jgi:biofilm PGA synthesis N-glycosyltransferase PgaC
MLTVFLLAAATQVSFWGICNRYAFPTQDKNTPEETSPFPPVSVIVCFRNEAKNIKECLYSILKQKYTGDFEVVAVDDNSTDNSAAIVEEFIKKAGGRLRLLQPGTTRPGKKDALAFGINNAHYEHILLTDADCLPRSNRWLSTMTRPLREGAEVVLGVGEYAQNDREAFSPSPSPGEIRNGSGGKTSNSTVDHFQRFEAIYVAIKYLSFAQMGLPYMGVGRNLAYQKSFFQRSGGFADHTDLPGGDDDLLVGGNAEAGKTVCVTQARSRTLSRLSGSWSVFMRQRMRHQSVGFRYQPVHQLALGLIALSHGLFFLLGLFLLFSSWWTLALLIYAVRFVLVLIAFRKSGLLGDVAGAEKGLKEQGMTVWTLPIFDAMLAPWYLFLAVAGTLPAKKW